MPKEVVDGLLQLCGVDDAPGRPAGPGPAGYRFEHRHIVHAPPEAIWQTLIKVSDWSKWSVLYPRAHGELKVGAWLDLIIKVPGTPGLKGRAEVLACVPGELVVFRSASRLGRLTTGVRYVQIEPIGLNRCVVTDGEVVGGWLGVGMARLIPGQLFKGLRLMNEGLKKEAESRGKGST